MTTKIVILGKPGDAINGKDIRLEVDGVFVGGEVSINICAEANEVATATVKLVLPEIEYRDSSLDWDGMRERANAFNRP